MLWCLRAVTQPLNASAQLAVQNVLKSFSVHAKHSVSQPEALNPMSAPRVLESTRIKEPEFSTGHFSAACQIDPGG